MENENRAALVLYFASIWQILRFVLLAFFALLGYFPIPSLLKTLVLLWLSVSQLVIAAGFFMLARFPDRYAVYRNLLALGKILDLLPSLAILVLQAASIFLGIGKPELAFLSVSHRIGLGRVNLALVFYFSVVLVVVLDLLFLFVLLSLTPKQESPEPLIQTFLPELNETTIEEE